MKEAEELLKRMRSLIQGAGDLSAELPGFIRAESLSLGEIVSDWLNLAKPFSGSGGCRRPYISEQETGRLIERRRAQTWEKAKQKFTSQELELLTSWQILEAKALTLAVNIALKRTLVYCKRIETRTML